jgi:tetratricopeptide (TPR) repeat protein
MKTRNRTVSVAAAVLAVGLGAATAGCGKYSFANLKATKAFKEANEHYRAQRWREAAERYEASLAAQPDFETNPNLSAAYFFLGNSYDNLYKPARKGEAENDQLLTKAIENYKQAAEKEQDPKIKKLALEYLVAAYGPDKLNDPTQAEPMVQRMIELDPKDPANYFALAKIYEDTGNYEQAEATLIKAREAKPNDPAVYMQLAGYYNRQGQFDKTIEALEQRASREPNNPESYYTIATYYWDKAFRDFRLKEPEKKEYVQKGIDASDRALKIKNDYMEALVYKGLLLRLAANMEKDRGKQEQYLKEADALRDKAKALQKQKSAGAGAGAGAGD